MSEPLSFFGSPQPLYMIGDSHCLIFRDLLFAAPTGQQTFITRAKYCPGLAAHNMVDGQGQLNTTLLHALYTELLLLPNGDGLIPRHLATTTYAEDFSMAIDQPRISPPLVFFLGELDLRAIFLKKWDPGSDFHLPPRLADANGHLEVLPALPKGPIVPLQLVTEFALQLLQPFLIGLGQLKRLGFEQLFVTALPPQTIDDREYEKHNQYACPAKLRYKALLYFNCLLAELCTGHGIAFLNTWPHLTHQDIFDARFYLDGQHLNKQSCGILIDLLFAQLYRNGPAVSEVLYQKWLDKCRKASQSEYLGINYDFYTQFIAQGYLGMPVDAALCQAIGNRLEFTPVMSHEHLRLDWVSYPAGVWQMAPPDNTVLAWLYEGFYQTTLSTWVASCLLCPFHLISVHPIRITPQAEPTDFTLTTLLAPPGVVRALLLLSPSTDSPSLFLQHRSGQRTMVPTAGQSLYLYNASEWLLGGTYPQTAAVDFLDIAIIPRLPTQIPLVMWAGLNLWPTDPEHFSRDGYLIYQPTVGEPQP